MCTCLVCYLYSEGATGTFLAENVTGAFVTGGGNIGLSNMVELAVELPLPPPMRPQSI